MQHYVVSEGRARALDAVNVRDRATYGLDWLVVYASSTRDAVHQWGLYKAGAHPTQEKLELEVAQYRSATAEYLPSWEAEADLVTRDVDESIESVEARQRELDEIRAGLQRLRADIQGVKRAAARPRPSPRTRRRRRAA